MKQYNPKRIEKKWQTKWVKEGIFSARDTDTQKKFYALVEFPYPSGEGLHVGHPRSYTAMDIIARKHRMQGENVLYPIGFDSFGLPTENYAIKTGKPPAEITKTNIANFTRQLKSIGFSFDWSRVVTTSDPKYYRWTQWIFLQLFKHGLAYKAKIAINWCPKDKIGLANEEVIDGCCERCGTLVEKREKEQWMLAITKYADKLLEGLKIVDYIPQAKLQQEHWIGRSEGAEIDFRIKNQESKIKVFTTRPDTIFGATYLVLAPEHPIVASLLNSQFPISNSQQVTDYIQTARTKTEIERTNADKEKTGVELQGIKAINPANHEQIPIWVADYVLANYGTGAIMAVPAHDERDFEFAKKHDLPMRLVIAPIVGGDSAVSVLNRISGFEEFYRGIQDIPGMLIGSGAFSGMSSSDAKKVITEAVGGKMTTTYKLRDWVFSRQRYWGEPIPLVYCEACKEKKYKYVFLHGYNNGVDSHFIGWLKVELEKMGHEVIAFNLPNFKKPNIEEQTKFVLDKVKIDEDTVLIGHSLGGAVIMKLLERVSMKVAQVLFVDCFVRPEFTDRERPDVVGSCDWKFDFAKIKNHSNEFIVLADKNFTVIPKLQSEQMAKLFDAKLILEQPTENHFKASVEPAVLNVLKNDGWVPLPEDKLPLELPKVEKYQPTDTGESPLAAMDKWVTTKCPRCGGPARRETDTMPNWAGSSWHFLRYCDPKSDKVFASREKLNYWMPVDWYNGGMEHTTLHLLYSRFWNEFLYDIGCVPVSEPYQKRTSHGLILAEDGEKMSKSRGNVVNPDEIVATYGADTLRVYEMFMGPFAEPVAWSTEGMKGVRRFLDRVWRLQDMLGRTPAPNETVLHQTIKKVTEDIEFMKFNTAVSQMMILVNEWYKQPPSKEQWKIFLKLLSPFAPHLAEELWAATGENGFIARASWPIFDPAKIVTETLVLTVQVNGKVRANFTVPSGLSERELVDQARRHENVQKWLDGKEPKKIVVVKGKLISFVV